jgi:hypothetical protein
MWGIFCTVLTGRGSGVTQGSQVIRTRAT